jgi:restriction system protein
MAVPDFQSLMLPLLKLAGDGQQHTLAETVEGLAQVFQLSDDDRSQLLRSGQTRLYNRVGWATTYLKKAGLLKAVGDV